MIIAIDGPAASGKGTLARRLAATFGLPHLDTGLLYRGVGARVLAGGASPDDAEAAAIAANTLVLSELDEDDLRRKEIGAAASRVAAHPRVREALLEHQRAFAYQPGGAVLDGRDIGTVICPQADAKIFVVASANARAQRRYRELTGRGETATLDSVLADIRQRDERDSGRATAPLKAAPDAIMLDTTHLDIEAAFAAALAAVREQVGAGAAPSFPAGVVT